MGNQLSASNNRSRPWRDQQMKIVTILEYLTEIPMSQRNYEWNDKETIQFLNDFIQSTWSGLLMAIRV